MYFLIFTFLGCGGHPKLQPYSRQFPSDHPPIPLPNAREQDAHNAVSPVCKLVFFSSTLYSNHLMLNGLH